MSLSTRTAHNLRRLANRLERSSAVSRPAPAPAPPAGRPPVPLATPSRPGSRVASMFFDEYPRFYETSQTTPDRGRLNLRYEAIFAENREIFEGARVLDIASHDGRWSLAALACGAQSVVGIEARPYLVEYSNDTLAQYGFSPERFTFITGDIYETLEKQTFEVDVVLCLGFLYHTLRYNELLHGIRSANPRHVIIDTISPSMLGNRPNVFVKPEGFVRESNAVADDYAYGDRTVVGQPNLKAIQVMARTYGFEVERLSDWDGLVRDNPGLEGVDDYARRLRQTIRCTDARVAAGSDA